MNKGFIIKYGPHFQCIKPIDIYVYLYLYWFRTSFSLCVRPWSPKAANYYCVKYCHSRINRISTSLMPSQLNKFLFSLKKGKHGSKQTAKHNNAASHGKCCCFVHWNGAALFTGVLMVCMKVMTLGETFHCNISNHADAYRDGWGWWSCAIILQSKKMCLSIGSQAFAMCCWHLVRFCSDIQPSYRQDLETHPSAVKGAGPESYPTLPTHNFLYLSSLSQEQEQWTVHRASDKSLVALAAVLLLSFSTAPSPEGGFAVPLVLKVIHQAQYFDSSF